MNNIRLFDTTMRDGEQGIGFSLTNQQKLHTLEKLSKLNVAVIELGMVTDKDNQALYEEASRIVSDTNISALCRLNETEVTNTITALSYFKNSTINLLCVSSEIHLNKKMNMSSTQVMALLEKSLEQIHKAGYKGNIYAIFEDATRGSDRYLNQQIRYLIDRGIRDICLADTVGQMTPLESYKFFYKYITSYPEVRFSCHFHNDLGLAVANTISAIEAGVREVQVTLGGIGERCGNASLEEVIAVLNHGLGYKGRFSSSVTLKESVEMCQFFYNVIGKHPYANKPLIGSHAFATCAGIHQNAINKNPETYEFIDPISLGLQRKFYRSKLSSKKLASFNPENIVLTKE
ncbi:hypothetical protein HWV03_04495 [Moritella sp. 36]|uniref:LeuA family protein n=1 Tax=Moritella sp. 36 TaxID=2746233 RepID=UPI001BA6C799|nr:LeuA family protein [Moritella sp. 36]QUM88136.1 hypothetical protein HWV03_04495 [Moritella sp. 36]